MKKDRIRWMLAVGLLGLLGFSSCSPRLRPRRTVRNVDTLYVLPSDTTRFRPDPGERPIRLMYGVPPVRYEVMDRPDQEKTK
jgi:hypothetical protein